MRDRGDSRRFFGGAFKLILLASPVLISTPDRRGAHCLLWQVVLRTDASNRVAQAHLPQV